MTSYFLYLLVVSFLTFLLIRFFLYLFSFLFLSRLLLVEFLLSLVDLKHFFSISFSHFPLSVTCFPSVFSHFSTFTTFFLLYFITFLHRLLSLPTFSIFYLFYSIFCQYFFLAFFTFPSQLPLFLSFPHTNFPSIFFSLFHYFTDFLFNRLSFFPPLLWYFPHVLPSFTSISTLLFHLLSSPSFLRDLCTPREALHGGRGRVVLCTCKQHRWTYSFSSPSLHSWRVSSCMRPERNL